MNEVINIQQTNFYRINECINIASILFFTSKGILTFLLAYSYQIPKIPFFLSGLNNSHKRNAIL